MAPDPTWWPEAACRGMATGLFFAADDVLTAEADEACNRRCTVQPECLDFALANRIGDGVWGGKTEKERRRIRRRPRSRQVA